MTQERIDIETMEARIRLWREGDISDEDLALEMDYMVPELKRCYEKIDWLQQAADLASNYIGEIHHSHWDIFEKRMIEAGLWERPSE